MRTAYALLGSWPAAEDAVQTAFTQLYVHWPRIQPGAVDTYARRTVVNTCFRMVKLRGREPATDDLPDRAVAGPEAGVEGLGPMEGPAGVVARGGAGVAGPDAGPGGAVAQGQGRGRAAIPRRPVDRRGGARPRPPRGDGQEPDRSRPRPPPGGARHTPTDRRSRT